MAYTKLKLDVLVQQVANVFGDRFKSANSLVANCRKIILPEGVNSKSLPIPGAVTAGTRVAGGNFSQAPQEPTPTDALLEAKTEVSAPISIDRLDASGSAYSIGEFEAAEAVDAILSKLNKTTWDLVGAAAGTNTLTGTSSSIKTLNEASKVLFNKKSPLLAPKYAVIGGDAWQSWKDAMTVSDYGMLGSGVVSTGQLPSAYGFYVSPDQYQYNDGTDNWNLAYHPDAIAIGYRSSMPEVPGQSMAMAIDDVTGIPIFVTEEALRDSNGMGIGTVVNFFLVADPVVVYAPWITKFKD